MDDVRIGGDGAEEAARAGSYAVRQATDAVERLRGVVEQAAVAMRDLSQASGEWAQQAHSRARDMAKEMRDQGEWAAGAMSRQVEQHPLTSIAVALGAGFMLGMLTRRWR